MTWQGTSLGQPARSRTWLIAALFVALLAVSATTPRARAAGAGSFGSKQDFPTGATPYFVALGDLNGDGKLDLVTANDNAAGTVSVLLGSGGGAFGLRQDYATGAYPASVAVGDLNGDGKLDLVTANSNLAGTVSVLLGTGTGAFGLKQDFPTGAYPLSVAVGDLNGDGKLDLVTANYTAGTVSVLLGTGTGTFGSPQPYAAGANPHSVALGDLNGDGKLDLVTSNYTAAGTVSVLLGTGTGTFALPQPYATGAYPYSVAVGDLNGDGKLDLVTANSTAGTVSVLLGTGTGTFGLNQDFPTGANPRSVAVGRLNWDDALDLVTANAGAASVSVLLNILVAPTVSGIGPATGPTTGGASVTVSGAGFQTGATVTIGGVDCAVTGTTTSTTITCATGAHAAGTVGVIVTNPDGQAGSKPGAFTYVAPPAVTSVTPSSGSTAGGQTVTVTGSGFQPAATVKIGGANCAVTGATTATTIACATGGHATPGTVNVVVTNPDAQYGVLTDGYTYAVPAPAVTGIAPASGSTGGGQAVTIGGAGFQTGATVRFASAACAVIGTTTSSTITCATGAHAAGIVDVVVTNPDMQAGSLANAYTYVAPPPPPPGWAGWSPLGGVLTDAPAAASFNGQLYLFAKGADNALYLKSSADGSSFTPWANLGGVLTDAPAAAAHNGRLYVFAKGVDSALYVKSSSDGVAFTGWTRLSGVLTAPPAATSFGGTLYVAVRGANVGSGDQPVNRLYVMTSTDGATFSNWRDQGGNLTAAPAAATFGGKLYFFARGAQAGTTPQQPTPSQPQMPIYPLYMQYSSDGVNFSDWQSLGGNLIAAPVAASYTPVGGAETLYTFATGADSTLYERHSSDGVNWTEWVTLGGQLTGPPAAAGVAGQQRLYAVVRWTDNSLWLLRTTP